MLVESLFDKKRIRGVIFNEQDGSGWRVIVGLLRKILRHEL
jgi:hypothetical protein